MTRRGFLTAVVLGAVGLSGCTLLPGGSGDSDAVAARLKAWLGRDPRVTSVAKLVGENYEGDVRAQAEITLAAPLTSAVLTDFMAAFFTAAGSDHWLVSISATPGLSIDSARDNTTVRGLPALWGHVAAEPSLTAGRVLADANGASFDATVSDDAVAHGLRLAGVDWVVQLAGYAVRGSDATRSCSYTAGSVDPADLAVLQRFAAVYRGGLFVTMRGTQQGELVLRPAADQVDDVKRLVASSGLPSSFKVTYQAPVATPSPSRT